MVPRHRLCVSLLLNNNDMKTKSLHVVGSIGMNSGGLGPFVRDLSRFLAVQGNEVRIITRTGSGTEPFHCENRYLHDIKSKGRLTRLFDIGFKSQIIAQAKGRTDLVVHAHSLWMPCVHHAAMAAKDFKRPFIISPHGCLEPWAFKYRQWKKEIALAFYQRKDFRAADGFHATALKEAEEFKKFGIKKPVAIIPIGVELPNIFPEEKKTGDKHIRTAFFLSRIHPIKGILKLLDVWAELKPSCWRLAIAGNDDQGHLKAVRNKIAKLELAKAVRYHGPVLGIEKDRLFREADLFILPSYSENFGIVVAEALSYGLPVITTEGTPWADISGWDCGWYVGTDAGSIGAALTEAFSLPESSLKEKGARGRKLIESKYQWPAIARDMNRFYSWLLGHGPQPEFVI